MSVSENGLALLDQEQSHDFITPVKKIHDGSDLGQFSSSQAYRDIMTFILQLNRAVFPCIKGGAVHVWTLESHDDPSEPISKIQTLIKCLDGLIDEAPPDPGPRRFGNIAFREWNRLAEERIPALLRENLPPHIFEWKASNQGKESAEPELLSYLLGSFGSAQRLDYGTGHELSFLAFIGCLWKLGVFPPSQNRDQERGIVLDIFEPYLRLVRRLILTYNLEPAGSHGVWGLDDHSFLPYIFGSAQLCPPVADDQPIPTEGSVVDAPKPSSVNEKVAVKEGRKSNMYFAAIGFIYDVKKGPFWEHSPILYDISGVPKGWAKINKGMIKMYNVEVLSKFPVVQHFQFGSLFSWAQDPMAKPAASSVHVSSQPKGGSTTTFSQPTRRVGQVPMAATSAPWAKSGGTSMSTPRTVAPWKSTADDAQPAPTSSGLNVSSARRVPARAPWAAPPARWLERSVRAGCAITLHTYSLSSSTHYFLLTSFTFGTIAVSRMMDYPIQRTHNGQDHEQPNNSSSNPPSNSNSDQSLAIGVDSQRFDHNEQQSKDFKNFLKEAEAKEHRDRRAGFHVEQTSIIENASLRTPQYQKRHQRSRLAIYATCVLFILSLASSVASLIIVIQDTLRFGPRASHVIWLIVSFAFAILLAMILLLLKWRHDHLKKTRTIVMERLKIEAAKEEAVSEQSSAYNDHLRNIERRSYEAATEAQKVQRALGRSLDTHQSVIEVMATAYARLKSEMVLRGIDESDLVKYQSESVAREEAPDDEESMQRNTASGERSSSSPTRAP